MSNEHGDPAPATPGDDVSELDELERLANEYEAAMTNEANEDLTRKQWVEAVVWAGEKLADAVRSSAAGFRALAADRDAHRAAAQEAEAERDALRAENERLMANAGVGGYSADAPDEVLLCGLADHGCDAWIHAVRLCPDNGKLDSMDVEAIAQGQYTQPVRYVRADKADALRRAVEALPKTADGVRVFPGMTVFYLNGKRVKWAELYGWGRPDTDGTCFCCHSQGQTSNWEWRYSFSTLEAAESKLSAALAPAAPPGDAGTPQAPPP